MDCKEMTLAGKWIAWVTVVVLSCLLVAVCCADPRSPKYDHSGASAEEIIAHKVAKKPIPVKE